MSVLLLLAATALSGLASPQCTPESAFGIAFGSSVDQLRASQVRSERPLSSFSAYRLNAQGDRFSQLIVEAGTDARKILSVKASVPISFKTTEEFRARIVPQARRLVEDISLDSGITVDTTGLPPYSGRANGVELVLDWESSGAGSSQFLHVTCTNQAIELEVMRSTPSRERLAPSESGGAL